MTRTQNFSTRQDYWQQILWNKRIVCLLLIMGIFFICKIVNLHMPVYWDAIQYIALALKPFFARNTLFIFILRIYTGIFSASSFAMHLLILFFSLVTLLYVYKLAFYFSQNRAIAAGAVLFLSFAPLFYAQSTIVTPAVFVTMFTVMSAYYLLQGRLLAYILGFTALCIAKENTSIIGAAIVVALLVTYVFKRDNKNHFPLYLLVSLIMLILAGYMGSHLAKDVSRNYYFGNIRDVSGMKISDFLIPAFLFLRDCQPLHIATLLYIITFIKRKRVIVFSAPLSIMAVSLFMVFVLFYGIYRVNLPRYWLPLYPFVSILTAYATCQCITDRKTYTVTIALVMAYLVFWCYFPLKDEGPFGSGARLERNMSYSNVITVHKKAAQYIERNLPNAIVGTFWPMTDELRYPSLGYINTPIKVRQLFDKPRPDDLFSVFRLSPTDIDAILYSPQADNSQKAFEYIQKYGWRLHMRFEESGCSASVYIKESGDNSNG